MPIIKMLLGNFKAMALLALVVAGGFAYLQYHNVEKELKQARDTIALKDQAIEDMGIQAEYLAQSIKLTEQTNTKLLKERDSLAKINAKHKQALNDLNVRYHLAQNQIANLRTSSDETIKTWANDCIPTSAIGLLKYARPKGCNENSSSDQN